MLPSEKSAAAGATSERKKKLNELTKKRSEKTKRATKKVRPPLSSFLLQMSDYSTGWLSQKRSASPGRESESESSSEGEHERKEMASSLRAEREKEDKEAISLVDIQSCTLRRGQLIDMLGHPAFEEYVVGASDPPLPPFFREHMALTALPVLRELRPSFGSSSTGPEGGWLPALRNCWYVLSQVSQLVRPLRLTTLSRRVVPAVVDNAKVYSLDRAQSSVQDNRRLTLKHGKAEKTQQMDIISNDAVTQVRSSPATPSHAPCAPEPEEKTD